jgi:hypothetical protein
MFGYIRPHESELRLREYRYYRGVYCGLCRAHGRCTGQCSRMTLSYDFVFFALCRIALENGNPTEQGERCALRFKARRCLPHPFRRRLSLEPGNATDHTALCAAMLNYHKLRDDLADERAGCKAWWRAVLLRVPVTAMYRRAARRAPMLAAQLSEAMQVFSVTEKQTTTPPSADAPAAAFGEVIALLLSHGLEGNRSFVARHLGLHIGKWLYFADALDDFAEDVRLDRPNPLRRLYGDAPLTAEKREAVAVAMGSELMRAEAAIDLLEVDAACCGVELSALLTHMIREALPRVTGALADGTYPRRKKQRKGKDKKSASPQEKLG